MQPRASTDTPARRDAATATFVVARREWEQVRAVSLALAGAPVAASARKSRAAGWGLGGRVSAAETSGGGGGGEGEGGRVGLRQGAGRKGRGEERQRGGTRGKWRCGGRSGGRRRPGCVARAAGMDGCAASTRVQRRRWGACACLCRPPAAWPGLLAVPGRGFRWSSVLCSCSCRAGRGVSPWTLGARNLEECDLCRASHVSCSVLSDTCAEMLGDFFTGRYWVKLGIGIT